MFRNGLDSKKAHQEEARGDNNMMTNVVQGIKDDGYYIDWTCLVVKDDMISFVGVSTVRQ
jgi:hypothetical protein